jgi:hypothetical protein
VPPIRKKITRRKPGSGPSVYYFTDATQRAIVAYKSAETPEEKEKLYVSEIYPAFKALVENLINVYNFQVKYESKDDLRNECLEFLYGVIGKFDPQKGSKAFAYFNVVAKHWLTIKAKQNTKSNQMFASMDDREAFSKHELEMIENHSVLPAPDETISQEEQTAALKSMLAEIRTRIKTSNETICMDVIDELFNDAEDLPFISKRAIMVYIRDYTHLSPKQLSVILSSLKKHYKQIKNNRLGN